MAYEDPVLRSEGLGGTSIPDGSAAHRAKACAYVLILGEGNVTSKIVPPFRASYLDVPFSC